MGDVWREGGTQSAFVCWDGCIFPKVPNVFSEDYLVLCHLVPEPSVEFDSTVVVAGPPDTPHQGEYEPGLNQLGNQINRL